MLNSTSNLLAHAEAWQIVSAHICGAIAALIGMLVHLWYRFCRKNSNYRMVRVYSTTEESEEDVTMAEPITMDEFEECYKDDEIVAQDPVEVALNEDHDHVSIMSNLLKDLIDKEDFKTIDTLLWMLYSSKRVEETLAALKLTLPFSKKLPHRRMLWLHANELQVRLGTPERTESLREF